MSRPRRVFQPKDPRLPRQPRTPAQETAQLRSFRIFQLRGLWSQLRPLSPGRREAAQAIIDDELRALGAETQAARIERERKLDEPF